MDIKNVFLLSLLTFSIISYSQISVSETPNKKTKEIDEEVLNRFNKTETIFILPNVVNKETYNSILKKYWKTTPYKLIDYKNFDFNNYLNDKYSFAYINTLINTIDKPRAINVYIYATLDIFMLKNKEIKKQLEKKKKKRKKVFEIKKNKIQLASVSLYPKNEYLRPITNARNNKKKLSELIYTKNSFYDFNAGFLKNEIQKISKQLKNKEPYYLYESDFLPEIKKLTNHKLYIPEYTGIKFNGMRETNKNKSIDYIKQLFKSYDFDFSIIKSNELSDKIINKEIKYYAKYTRVNTQRFFNIINAETGEIIYRKHLKTTYHLQKS